MPQAVPAVDPDSVPADGESPRSRLRLRLSLSTLVTGLMVLAALCVLVVVLATVKLESRGAAIDSARMLFDETTTAVGTALTTDLRTVAAITEAAALSRVAPAPAPAIPSVEDSAAADPPRAAVLARDLETWAGLLAAQPHLMSLYVGEPDGSFHQVIATRANRDVLARYDAPPDTVVIDRRLIRSPNGTAVEQWRFLDASLSPLATREDTAPTYDPRSRPWYQKALAATGPVFTAPYVFSSSRLPGLTVARILPRGGGVFGADMTLAQLGDLLTQERPAEYVTLWVMSDSQALVAWPGLRWDAVMGDSPTLPALASLDDPIARAVAANAAFLAEGRAVFLDVTGAAHLAQLSPLLADQGLGLAIGVAAPLTAITGHIDRMAWRILVVALAALLLLVPLALILARRAARDVRALGTQAARIEAFDFTPAAPIRSAIHEVEDLARATEVMKTTIAARTISLEQTRARLEKLVQGGFALAAEKELARLVALLFETAKDLAGADGGVVYLLDGDTLEVEMLSLATLGETSLVLGGLSDTPAPRVMVKPAIRAFLSPDSVLRSACDAFATRDVVALRDVPLTLFPTGLTQEPKDITIRSVLAVPIITRRDEVLGVLQLFNPRDSDDLDGTDGQHNVSAVAFVRALAAQAAVTLDNRNLVTSLKDLFDALVQVIALSIDAKSPYTAGHCTRVPVLAELLAQAAHDTETGPLAAYRLETPEDRRQLWIAAWLHDCGKVTTPEYVVDKATKLETIHDRIHEVRTRFEILRRDAEIAYWHGLVEGRDRPEDLAARRDATIARLEEDFAFVAQCNTGETPLSDDDITRLHTIGAQTWMRHFSDRLGLSHDALMRRGEAPEAPLPVAEPLLANKPEHCIPRSRTYADIKDATGQPIRCPEHEYNRGEIYNLSIRRGTLTAEDRFKINEHALNSLVMLRRIPFPEGMTRVPEIAASHHETLVGTGYPLRKSRDDLSIEARILAIADVFEALTASDRPYKRPKTLSESLRIMAFMRNDQHIDPDLFDAFLDHGVFRRYAEAHLTPDQIDVDDITPYRRPAAPLPT